ncbi:COG1361 S-layer family protein [Candidatus Pyrohabitans sp.]
MKRMHYGPRILLLLSMMLAVPAVAGIEADFYAVSIAPTQVEPGETAILNITLKNLAPTYAVYLKASLDPDDTSPVDAIGALRVWLNRVESAQESPRYFGVVLRGDEVTLSYPIHVKLNTPEGVYKTPLKLVWQNNLMEEKTQTILLGILVKGGISLGVASVDTDPAKIRSGDDNVKIVVKVHNSGEAVAKNVRARLITDGPFKPSYSNKNLAYLGRLDAGTEQTATFYLDVEETARPGNYVLPLLLSYEDLRNNRFEVQEEVNIIVEPKPYFDVVGTKLVPELPKPGERALLYLDIKNIGHENGESVDVRVVREAGQPFSFDIRSDFIGTLKPGETGTAALEFDIDKDAIPKEYLLRLIVRATGDTEKGDTNIYTQELKAPVSVGKGGKSSNSLRYAALLAGIAVAAGLLYRRRKQSTS